eukprot:scaffold1008_cov106-Skeletonema_dohrnii-CCMP3373.AAC.6
MAFVFGSGYAIVTYSYIDSASKFIVDGGSSKSKTLQPEVKSAQSWCVALHLHKEEQHATMYLQHKSTYMKGTTPLFVWESKERYKTRGNRHVQELLIVKSDQEKRRDVMSGPRRW